MSLPGNYASRPSGYANWVGTQAARAVAAYVLDNGHHLIAPYLGTTETARRIPPISYMDKISLPAGPGAWKGEDGVARIAMHSKGGHYMAKLPKLPTVNKLFRKGLKGKVRRFRKPRFKRRKSKRT